jgi:hypothetical protein
MSGHQPIASAPGPSDRWSSGGPAEEGAARMSIKDPKMAHGLQGIDGLDSKGHLPSLPADD